MVDSVDASDVELEEALLADEDESFVERSDVVAVEDSLEGASALVIVPDVSTPLLIVVSVLHPAIVNAVINIGNANLNLCFMIVYTSFLVGLLGIADYSIIL